MICALLNGLLGSISGNLNNTINTVGYWLLIIPSTLLLIKMLFYIKTRC